LFALNQNLSFRRKESYKLKKVKTLSKKLAYKFELYQNLEFLLELRHHQGVILLLHIDRKKCVPHLTVYKFIYHTQNV
jgi:hypothetical protein